MKITVVSIAAKNIHKSLAPWCLKAFAEKNGYENIEIIETNINVALCEIVARIMASKPDVLTFSCYIWNIDCVRKIEGLMHKLLPDVEIILGGPELEYKFEGSLKAAEIFCGIYDFCEFPTPFTEQYFASFGEGGLPIENQLIYYESSRGCPNSCRFCLSSAIDGVFFLNLDRVKKELRLLVDNGAKCIKFVDRNFNSHKARAKEILTFILSLKTDCVFHFEASADLFDEEMLQIVQKMPKKRVQFEIGIQSVNENTLREINRKTNLKLSFENIKKLVSFETCKIHLDLIAGLPHETIESFIVAVNECILCRPHYLQFGFLKMLKGTQLRENAAKFGAVYADFPPYEIFSTNSMDFQEIFKLKKIEAVIDKFYNSGSFSYTVEYAIFKLFNSPYDFFEKLSEFISDLRINLKKLYTALYEFLLLFGEKKEIEHYIKLDSLCTDSKGLLPNAILSIRDKEKEHNYKKNTGNSSANIRIEYFEFDNKYRLFNYDGEFIMIEFEA